MGVSCFDEQDGVGHGPLGAIGRHISNSAIDPHRGRATAVEIDGLLAGKRPDHEVGELLEAHADALGGPAIDDELIDVRVVPAEGGARVAVD